MTPKRAAAIPADLAESKAAWHRAQAALPLIAKLRPLRSWERPWPIEP